MCAPKFTSIMVVAGASMFGLMVFTCVGRFRRKDESYDSCSWNTAYLKLALFLDVTYAIVFEFDWLCSLSLCLIYLWWLLLLHIKPLVLLNSQPHTHTSDIFENSTIFIEKLVRSRHIADLRTSCEYTENNRNLSKKTSLWNLGYDLN